MGLQHARHQYATGGSQGFRPCDFSFRDDWPNASLVMLIDMLLFLMLIRVLFNYSVYTVINPGSYWC